MHMLHSAFNPQGLTALSIPAGLRVELRSKAATAQVQRQQWILAGLFIVRDYSGNSDAVCCDNNPRLAT
jgi:hypothetical protein